MTSTQVPASSVVPDNTSSTLESDPTLQPKFTHDEIVRFQEIRPERSELQKFIALPLEDRDLVLSAIVSQKYRYDLEKHQRVLGFTKEYANEHFKAGHYQLAIRKYQDAIGAIFENKEERGYLLRKFYNPNYLFALDSDRGRKFAMFIDLVSCCNNIAQIYLKLNKKAAALDWLQEVEVLYECLKYQSSGTYDPFPATLMRLPYLELATFRMKTALRYIHLFMQIKNTAAAGYFFYRCTVLYPHWFPEDVPEIQTIVNQCDPKWVYSHKHPDVETMDKWSVEFPEFQLRGTWTKISARLNNRPPRQQHKYKQTAWIWKSRLYVRWGLYYQNELWYLDLKRLSKWKRTTPIPERMFNEQPCLAKPVIYDNQVWFFSFRQDILRFDLITESWNCISTTIVEGHDQWPWDTTGDLLTRLLNDCHVELYKNKMCVLGTSNTLQPIFVILDLVTLKWEHQFPIVSRNQMQEMPYKRYEASTWAVEEEEKLFFMYGELPEEKNGKLVTSKERLCGELYSDLWSFSFKTKTWMRERLCGNFPSPRQDMAHAYHKGLRKVVVFGGMSDKIPVYAEGEAIGDYYSCFADTFVMDIDSRKWKQVVTRGFPAWRRGSRMVIDDSDGKIYIYGGAANYASLFRTDNGNLHYFGDIWRLDLDVPGHHFNEKSFYKLSSFKAGSYRRCYTCQSLGRDYLRCQGTCGGKHIYCSKDCQRKAWRVHRTIHGCQRRLPG